VFGKISTTKMFAEEMSREKYSNTEMDGQVK